MVGKLTPEGMARAAAVIGCDVPAIRAVIAVEAAGAGFLSDGRPKILFERHIFHRRTHGAYDLAAPGISDPAPGGYLGGSGEYARLYTALQYDAGAAVESASWGLGQLMGFNWGACGEKSLFGFLLAMHNSEDAQLALMAQFIKSQGLDDNLRRHDWPGFAKGYNGVNYAKNNYDTKLAAAYASASRIA